MNDGARRRRLLSRNLADQPSVYQTRAVSAARDAPASIEVGRRVSENGTRFVWYFGDGGAARVECGLIYEAKAACRERRW
jgi:hypothetical protein